jgi:hypothetical protein
MSIGFRLFATLSAWAEIHEVFPTASYNQLAADEAPAFTVSLSGFSLGPKDMLDAYVAAYTVHEYAAGRGVAVGGGDGLGTIVLPRPLRGPGSAVLSWPG